MSNDIMGLSEKLDGASYWWGIIYRGHRKRWAM